MELAAREERMASDMLPAGGGGRAGAADAHADQALSEARIRERLGVPVVAVTRGGGHVVLTPSAETIVRAGDRARIFGLPVQIEASRLEVDNAWPTS